MSLVDYVNRIKKVSKSAKSESKLEGEMNQILKDCLNENHIDFDPFVNVTLNKLGISQINSDRPDGVFGHIVFDYKAPGALSNTIKLRLAKLQIVRYLDHITGGHDNNPDECRKWIGFLFDGETFYFCRSDTHEWCWMLPMPLSENTLLFLVHVFRSLQRKPLTSQLLSSTFGKDTEVASTLIRFMCDLLSNPKHKTNMLLREWKRLFEQVSTFNIDQLPSLKKWAIENGLKTQDASHILFALHTFYSLIVKILTSELLSISSHNSISICEEIVAARTDYELFITLGKLENGDYYRSFRISNFLEGDFFSWYVDEKTAEIADAIRCVATEFLQFEPASAILLSEYKQDLLKEFYSSLVDEQIRHDLGEYYTPDWLAQYLLNQANYQGEFNKKLLDPTCGSGTFLIEAINRLKQSCLNAGFSSIETLETILANIKGLDLNPLAVISARANYILAIFELVVELGSDIELPVYLADSINVPIVKKDAEGSNYLEYSLDTEIENFILEIPLEIVQSGVIGFVLLECEEAVKDKSTADQFIERIRNKPGVEVILSESVMNRLKKFYKIIVSLEERDWDKIWCRIIKNNFSPRGFDKFDLIIGNPPWVRWSRLPESYRNRVKKFCKYYGLVSGQAYTGGIESDISTVITFSAADNWLKVGGKIAFLITNTVFKSSSAKGFRLGKLPDGSGLKLIQIEDLSKIQPFQDANNATGIYVAEKVEISENAIVEKASCKIWKPKTRVSRIQSSISISTIDEICNVIEGVAIPVGDWGTPFFTGEKVKYEESAFLRGRSEYIKFSHRGIITDAARVYWVKVLQFSNVTKRALIRTLTVQELPKAQEIEPTNGAWIESDLLFPLIRGRNLGRYSSGTEGYYQIIPNHHYENMETEQDFRNNYPLTYAYLQKYEDVLNSRSTYKRYQAHLPFYVVYCVGDYSFSPYKVAWMEQQDPSSFKASIISTMDTLLDQRKPIVPDHKIYFATFNSKIEANYLCGFLNSKPVRIWLGGFLLGKQIGTSIFEYMKVPQFNCGDKRHIEISKISEQSHTLRTNLYSNELLDQDEEDRLSFLVKSICIS